jgi:hypothetical protein
MCQTYLAWLRILTATNEGYLRYGVVRTAERTLTDEARITTQFASNTMYLGSFQTL